jgi:hypothetical protein
MSLQDEETETWKHNKLLLYFYFIVVQTREFVQI